MNHPSLLFTICTTPFEIVRMKIAVNNNKQQRVSTNQPTGQNSWFELRKISPKTIAKSKQSYNADFMKCNFDSWEQARYISDIICVPAEQFYIRIMPSEKRNRKVSHTVGSHSQYIHRTIEHGTSDIWSWTGNMERCIAHIHKHITQRCRERWRSAATVSLTSGLDPCVSRTQSATLWIEAYSLSWSFIRRYLCVHSLCDWEYGNGKNMRAITKQGDPHCNLLFRHFQRIFILIVNSFVVELMIWFLHFPVKFKW